MKKVLNAIDFQITEESINLVNEIINKMDGNTFHNHYHILYDICNSIDNDNIKYFEIGSFAGGSASLMSTNSKVSYCYSLDIGYPVNKEIPIRNVNNFKHNKCEYEYIEGDSTNVDIVRQVTEKITNIDILFIDGEHSRNGVISDFNNYEKIVKQNGYIVFDDYMDDIYSPEVFGAVNEIVDGLDSNLFEIMGSVDYDLIKKTNCPDFKSSNLFVIKKL